MPCCSAEAFSELPALQLVKAFLFSFLVDGFNYPLVLDGSFFDTSTRSLNFSLGADCAVMYALSGFFAYVTFNLCHFWPLGFTSACTPAGDFPELQDAAGFLIFAVPFVKGFFRVAAGLFFACPFGKAFGKPMAFAKPSSSSSWPQALEDLAALGPIFS